MPALSITSNGYASRDMLSRAAQNGKQVKNNKFPLAIDKCGGKKKGKK